jgi:hypothetical protein
MNKDKFELSMFQLNLIFLLEVIDAEPDKNIKQSDLELLHGVIFKRQGIENVLLSACQEGLVINKNINIGDSHSNIITLTEKGKDYISRVS